MFFNFALKMINVVINILALNPDKTIREIFCAVCEINQFMVNQDNQHQPKSKFLLLILRFLVKTQQLN